MTQEERNAIALCCGLLEGIADRNVGDYAQQIVLGIKAIKGTLQEEPVSEDYKNALNSEAITFLQEQQIVPNFYADIIIKAVKHGAKWQKEQLMAKAIDAQCFGFQGAALFSVRLPSDKYLVGSNVKVIVIKED